MNLLFYKKSESFLNFFLVEHYIRHGLEERHLLLKYFEIFKGNLFYMDLPKRFKQLLQPYRKNSTIELHHQFTNIFSPIHEYIFSKIWGLSPKCHHYKIILMMCKMHFDAPSRFKKGWMISIQKKTINIKKRGLGN